MIDITEDKLDRDEILNKLFQIFNNFGNQDNQGLTMAINGRYGMGKSTLLNFIEQKNKEENLYNIVLYDAWKSNLFENPIIPLMYSISKISSTGNKLKNVAKKVVKAIPMMLTKTLANTTNIDITSAIESQDIFKEYDDFNKAIDECKKILAEICQNKKTVLLVDELDRCLPNYQIKVLESLYHFLNIPNLIIVIALDREQLEEAIRNEFGNYTDTYGYLSKFIQYEIDLPTETTANYSMSLMNFRSQYDQEVKQLIAMMLDSLNISTRDVKIIIRDLNLICKEQKDGFGYSKNYIYYYPIIITFLLLLKSQDANTYKKYFGKELDNSYESEIISISNTRYHAFLQDIKQNKFYQIITTLQTNPYGQSALLHVINLFDNVDKIKHEDLAICIKRSVEDVQKLLKSTNFMYWYFPSSVNNIIKQLKIIL